MPRQYPKKRWFLDLENMEAVQMHIYPDGFYCEHKKHKLTDKKLVTALEGVHTVLKYLYDKIKKPRGPDDDI